MKEGKKTQVKFTFYKLFLMTMPVIFERKVVRWNVVGVLFTDRKFRGTGTQLRVSQHKSLTIDAVQTG
jgi:hypothetical protein